MNQEGFQVSREKSNINSQVLYISKRLYTNPNLKTILDSFPDWTLIFNDKTELVFANEAFLSFSGLEDVSEILGQKPGVVVRCSYEHECGEECGTGEKCKHCALYQIILQSRKKKEAINSLASLSVHHKNKSLFVDLKATPFVFENKNLTILHLKDAGIKKKSENLENIILEKVSGSIESVKGYLDFLREIPDRKSMDQYISTARIISDELKEELDYLRVLEQLENGEYEPKTTNLESIQFIYDLLKSIENSSYAEGKRFIIDVGSEEFNLNTDPFLLKTVLCAMFKNAMEATEPGGSIKLGVTSEDNNAFVWVANKSAMSEIEQLHLFEKYFTTKKGAMGLGGYLMKLIVEEYLEGNVYFESNPEKGSFFSIKIPQIRS